MTSADLKDLLFEVGLARKDLAKKLGVGRSTVYYWTEGRKDIPQDKAKMIMAVIEEERKENDQRSIDRMILLPENPYVERTPIDMGPARMKPEVLRSAQEGARYRELCKRKAGMG